jgi:hypothetical protein
MEQNDFYKLYGGVVLELNQKEILDAWSEPTGFEEDEYVVILTDLGIYKLFESTGSGVIFHGEYSSKEECALVYSDWC